MQGLLFGFNLMNIFWKESSLLVGTACTQSKSTMPFAGGSRKSLPGGALSYGMLSYWLVCMDLLVGDNAVADLSR